MEQDNMNANGIILADLIEKEGRIISHIPMTDDKARMHKRNGILDFTPLSKYGGPRIDGVFLEAAVVNKLGDEDILRLRQHANPVGFSFIVGSGTGRDYTEDQPVIMTEADIHELNDYGFIKEARRTGLMLKTGDSQPPNDSQIAQGRVNEEFNARASAQIAAVGIAIIATAFNAVVSWQMPSLFSLAATGMIGLVFGAGIYGASKLSEDSGIELESHGVQLDDLIAKKCDPVSILKERLAGDSFGCSPGIPGSSSVALHQGRPPAQQKYAI